MHRSEHWDAIYARGDEGLSWFQAEPVTSLQLVRRFASSPGDAIVDVGGGTSRLVDRLLESGFRDLTVVDIAESAISRARQRLGDASQSVRWILGDITALHDIGTFHLWHDRALFHFLVDPSERLSYLALLKRSVLPGGHALIATFAPDGPDTCSGLPVDRYDARALAEELNEPFELVLEQQEEHITASGARQPFTWAVFRAPPQGS